MAAILSQAIDDAVKHASQLYHRLVILVGPPRSGKTSALRELHAAKGWPLVNFNLVLSERLLDLTTRQRALRAARIADDIVSEHGVETILLDNIELLFDPELKQDPLRLLEGLSRNRIIVATWPGSLHGRSLVYANPGHPEYRRFDDPQSIIISTQPTVPTGSAAVSE